MVKVHRLVPLINSTYFDSRNAKMWVSSKYLKAVRVKSALESATSCAHGLS